MMKKMFRELKNFVRLMRGMPPIPSGVSKAGAKQAGEAMHSVACGGGGFTGTSATDGVIGKAIASDHQKKV